jgi:triosephosphate isomerase (TIM)
MRKTIVAGNWKLNLGPGEGVALVKDLLPLVAGVDTCDVVVCPPYLTLDAVGKALQGSKVGLGAQNVHWEESGAFTGEVSPSMLLTTGCRWVILGHSERRQLFGETDEGVNKRLFASLAAGLHPIVCVGETLEERDAGRVDDVVLGQIDRSLQGLSAEKAVATTVAYEPVWAIGTGRTASPEQAEEVHALIRQRLAQTFGEDTAQQMRLQYGGSVKPDNAAELFGQKNIDGGLIGGAALDAEGFAAIVRAG